MSEVSPYIEKSLGWALFYTEDENPRGWPCEVVVSLDPDIEFNPIDGSVDYVHSYFETRWWRDGEAAKVSVKHPYGDKRFAEGVRTFLRNIGHPDEVGWSTQGHQTPELGDFDASNETLQSIFPEAFEEARKKFEAARPSPIPEGVVEYSVTAEGYHITLRDAAGDVIEEQEGENNATPRIPLHGSWSMTSIADEQARRLAGLYRVPKVVAL